MEGYANPAEALADGCKGIKLLNGIMYQKELEDGRTFNQIYSLSDKTMGKPMIFPKGIREGFHDCGC